MELNLRTFLELQNLLVSFRLISEKEKEIICQMPDPPPCLCCLPGLYSCTGASSGRALAALSSLCFTLGPGPRNPLMELWAAG